jgi:hypothetical protein
MANYSSYKTRVPRPLHTSAGPWYKAHALLLRLRQGGPLERDGIRLNDHSALGL